MIARAATAVAAVRRSPGSAALALAVISAAVYVIAYPLAVVRYPPMTDLPFHAAGTAVLRHYLDPAWHFREQFTLQPLAVPYLSMYAIGALLMLALPPTVAVKVAAAVMLALLPAGLAVLFYGMKRSPLLGVLGLGVVWCNLTHWGFLNFVGALGLFAMVVGLTLLLVDRPTPGRKLALALALIALFFTHVFRFPFALCAVVGTALVMYPATRRLRPIVLPLLPAVVLLLVWLRVRTDTLREAPMRFELQWSRLREIPDVIFAGFTDPAERIAAGRGGRALVFAMLLCAALRIASGAARPILRRPRELAFAMGAAIAPLACAAVFFALFLILPMQIGLWWYVYPREIVAALYMGLAAFPDLPRPVWLKAPIVLLLAAFAAAMGSVVADNYRTFNERTRDFDAIIAQIPEAPKLLYLVFDHGGSTRTTTPFIHLPAWVQATRGGWLSFHFAVWNATPIAYRPRSDPFAVVPPETPLRWEWTPEKFDVKRHGAFFDWFLVRRGTGHGAKGADRRPGAPNAQAEHGAKGADRRPGAPNAQAEHGAKGADRRPGAPNVQSSVERLFAADPTIVLVDHVGDWWLFRRAALPR